MLPCHALSTPWEPPGPDICKVGPCGTPVCRSSKEALAVHNAKVVSDQGPSCAELDCGSLATGHSVLCQKAFGPEQ